MLLPQITRRWCTTAARNAKIIDEDSSDLPKMLWDTFLKLERINDVKPKFRSVNLLRGRRSQPYIYGGQYFAHALKAACETVNSSYTTLPPHSMHSYFIKAGSAYEPVDYVVDVVRDGGSFATRRVHAMQNDQLLFEAQISFHGEEKSAISHEPVLKIPEKGPDDLLSARVLMEKCLKERPKDVALGSKLFAEYKYNEFPPTFHGIFETRPVNQDIYSLRKQPDLHTPEFTVWVRPTLPIGNNYYLQALLAAYMSDATMVETAILPHLSKKFIPGMVFSLDHCVWFHKSRFNMDDWMIYEQNSDYAGAGRTFTRARLFTRTGELVMSACQEGLARALGTEGKSDSMN